MEGGMDTDSWQVVECTENLRNDWILLRTPLYPECSAETHERETTVYLKAPERYGNFLLYVGRMPVALLEVCLRHDYVNGTESSPVGFIEGIFVAPEARRKGVASLLFNAAEDWARKKGCSEIASDVYLDNQASHDLHKALGFEETTRVVYYRKKL